MEEAKKTLIKNLTFAILSFAGVFIACIWLTNSCEPEVKVQQTDTLTTSQHEKIESIQTNTLIVESLKRQVDSLLSLKPTIKTKIIHHYTTLHDSIPVYLRDDLDSLQGDWLDMEVINLNVIARQDSVLSVMGATIDSYKKITHNDSIRMGQLSDSFETEFKRGLRKGRKQGFVLGIGLSGAVWVADKIRP